MPQLQANRPDSLKALRADIRAVVDYNWSDELADFETHEGDGQHHIFATIVRLDNWLNSTGFIPESYVKKGKA